MAKYMRYYWIIFMLISIGVCDTNMTTVETSTITTPSTASSSTQRTTTETTTSSTAPSTTPATVNATKISHSISNRTQILNTTSYLCSCDISFDCDVNCCCDIDCNAEIIEAFECALGVEIDDFFHGEGLERCGVDGGLLCIAHDNVSPMDKNLHMPYYTEYSSYKWPKISRTTGHESVNELSVNDFYKFGDAIMTYDTRNEKYQKIIIPALTIGDNSNCFLTEPVMFLKSKSIQCRRSYNELCTYNNNLMTQLMHSRLFHRPPKSTSTQEVSEAFNIVIESCKHTFDNCTQMNVIDKNINNVEELQEYLYDDVYEDIQLIFYINDTKLLSATIKFGCHNELTCNNNDELETTKIIQKIQIKFVNTNENRMERRIRKKQRGYSDDELIIATRRRPLNESITAPSSNTEMIFDYFRNDTSMNKIYFMRLPKVTGNGKCIMNDNHYDLIRFNENSHTSCTAELVNDANSNFTLCQQFQHQLMHHLLPTLNLTLNYTLDGFASDVYVSKYWTPQYDINSWVRTSFYNIPPWSPKMEENGNVFICSNLITTANYKFFYSSIRASGGTKYEHFIENLLVEFSNSFDERTFSLDDENQTTQNVKIQVNVQFVNLFHKNYANINAKMNIFIIFLCILLSFTSLS